MRRSALVPLRSAEPTAGRCDGAGSRTGARQRSRSSYERRLDGAHQGAEAPAWPAPGAGMSGWRDTTCGALRADDAGKRVTVAGWADTRRDHGGLVFVDLRDYSGKVQLVINPERAPDAAAVAHEIRNEFVLQAEGEVTLRAPDAVNPNIPTGEIEVQVDKLTIVSRSEPLPFQIGDENVDEVIRLRYRY